MMTRQDLCALTLLVALLTVAAAEANGEARTPVLVLIESDPWDVTTQWLASPTVALYDDGLVIYRKLDRGTLMSTVLDQEEQRQLLSSLPLDALRDVQEEHRVSRWSHPPYNELYIWNQGALKRVAVMGFLRNPEKWAAHPSPEFVEAVKEERAKIPPAFLQLFDALIDYDHANASAWTPETIEVLLWPLSDPPMNPLAWPAEWPGPSHPNTKRWGIGYLVVLDVQELDKVKQMRVRLWEEGQALLFDGKAMTIDYRIPFPSEQAWRNPAFQGASDEATETTQPESATPGG